MKKILAIDIETVRDFKEYSELPETLKNIWDKRYINRKSNKIVEEYEKPEFNLPEKYKEEASFFPEFSKIVCISVSFLHKEQIHSFIGDEKTMLKKFSKSITTARPHALLGHNILGFDVPFLFKKFIQHDITIPNIFKRLYTFDDGIIEINKPWNVSNIFLDTMQIFKGTSYEYYSLSAICECFGIQTPKDDIDGSEVAEVFWSGDIERIKKYCEKDVFAVKKIYKKFISSLNSDYLIE